MLQTQAAKLKALLDYIILSRKVNADISINVLQSLGERHATFLARESRENDLSLEDWDAFTQAFLDEIRATNQTTGVEEREMQILCWTHFMNAIVGVVQQAYEEELGRREGKEEEEEEVVSVSALASPNTPST